MEHIIILRINKNKSIPCVSPRHLQHRQRDVGRYAAGRVAGGAGVDAHVGRHDLKDLVRVGLRHHADAALAGGLSKVEEKLKLKKIRIF